MVSTPAPAATPVSNEKDEAHGSSYLQDVKNLQTEIEDGLQNSENVQDQAVLIDHMEENNKEK